MTPALTRAAFRGGLQIALVISLATVACHSATEPKGMQVTFEPRVAFGLRSPIGVTAPGTVSVHWSLLSPCQPYDATARLMRAADTIAVIVTGKATGPCPMDIVSGLPYRVEIRGIPAGRYTIRILHRYADVAWPEEIAVEAEVDVP